ncbi:MAG: peptidyl-tRNA hydrolase [Candidatus Heimdallarchaeaceae archaeon]
MVTRRDIHPGAQASQLVHAALEYSVEYPGQFKSWHTISNHIALLSIEDEKSLVALAEKLRERGLSVTLFQEPDLNNQYTSFTVEACDRARKLTSHLPLAFKEYDVVYNKIKKGSLA